MARLNDVPPSAESVESLKRRFARQNREIARANSIQSLRIRSLEAEMSRLHAENCSLRERIISLNNEHEKHQIAPSRRIDGEIMSLKEKMEDKVTELNSLIHSLGLLPQQRAKFLRESRETADPEGEGDKEPVAKHIYEQKKMGRQAFVSAMQEEHARLPVIDEDQPLTKVAYDPMDFPPPSIENRDYTPETSESQKTMDEPAVPDIAQTNPGFAEEVSEEALEDSSESPVEEQEPGPVLSQAVSNLEARRKENLATKRSNHDLSNDDDAASWRSIRNEIKENADPYTFASNVGGVKRKASDDDNIPRDHRKETDENSMPSNNQPKLFSRTKDLESTRKLVQSLRDSSSRRALGPKNGNIALESPAKKRLDTTVAEDMKKPSRKKALESISSAVSQKSHQNKSTPGDIEPVDDVKSPVAPEPPSESREEKLRGDTPPPPSTGSSRPSRRARATISYAEPSLRHKMRRPSKDTTDDEKRRSSARADMVPSSRSSLRNSVDSVKVEDQSSSPIGTKSGEIMDSVPRNMISGDRRRTHQRRENSESDAGTNSEISSTGHAISALMVGGRTRRTSPDVRRRRARHTDHEDDPRRAKEEGSGSRHRRTKSRAPQDSEVEVNRPSDFTDPVFSENNDEELLRDGTNHDGSSIWDPVVPRFSSRRRNLMA